MENKTMCEITAHGYKMKDGTVIPFKKLNMGEVSPEHIEEMNRAYASVWGMVLLRNDLLGLKDEIKKELSDQITKLTDSLEKHGKYCPANEDRIKEIINEEINQRTDLKIRKSAKIFDLMWKAAIVILVVVNIYLFILGKNPIQITP